MVYINFYVYHELVLSNSLIAKQQLLSHFQNINPVSDPEAQNTQINDSNEANVVNEDIKLETPSVENEIEKSSDDDQKSSLSLQSGNLKNFNFSLIISKIHESSGRLPRNKDPFCKESLPLPKIFLDDSNDQPVKYNSSGGIHIITSFFRGNYTSERVKEILLCLERNLENPLISAVHVLWEDENPRQLIRKELRHKLITSVVKGQPTYFRFFSYADLFLERGSIAVIVNADIFFDKSIGLIKFGHFDSSYVEPSRKSNAYWQSLRDVNRTVLALTRRHADECGAKNDWKHDFDLCENYVGSHDAFIFAPPTPCKIIENSRHYQNRMGAENKLIWGIKKDKRIRLLNPCNKIIASHYRKFILID